ncbi:hypothetical protein [Pseudoxanthomonas winnipegensis]|uniref:hypothetical protein n=1 Tax=Pseudoxanthomonas winnipegensis TaxID=2480810 RepID=UPI0010397DEA|nr:hypothetical protein [Pseudoxanthomonas winnipegensis]TBV70625.1 hypothetical protein EYC45_18205 [Pseudoxanthomonas winnipegensis]
MQEPFDFEEHTFDDALPLADAIAAVDAWTIQARGNTVRIAHDPDGKHSLAEVMKSLEEALLMGLVVTLSDGVTP